MCVCVCLWVCVYIVYIFGSEPIFAKVHSIDLAANQIVFIYLFTSLYPVQFVARKNKIKSSGRKIVLTIAVSKVTTLQVKKYFNMQDLKIILCCALV